MKNKLNQLRCQIVIPAIILIALSVFSGITASADNNTTSQNRYWVFLGQKKSINAIRPAEKAIWRRTFRANLQTESWYDLSVDPAAIDSIRLSGAAIRTISRWLNAVSVSADSLSLENLRGLSFISKITPVAVFKETLPPIENMPFRGPAKPAVFDYGQSQQQVAQLEIDSLHNTGLSGHGVMIGVMDTGFDTSHVAFRRMTDENRVIATHDFLNGDSNVMDLYTSQRGHGTAVLSCLGGFDEGHLVGTAFGADFILAKTESLYTYEEVFEEDCWVAAAEWMESLGVDIISSSLGYTDWYDTTQLDGHTAVITQAANIANSLGVIVVNSAGNEGDNPRWRKVTPPSDGDSVLAIGAVDANGSIASFSSRGPTADGRIKPDICAMGVADWVAIYTGGYGALSGTSFAAPLIAGGVALLLESHPDWTLADVISALKAASSRATQPNNSYGWGIPNFVRADLMQPYVFKEGSSVIIAPQPAQDSVVFHIKLIQAGKAVLSIHDLSGAKIAEHEFNVQEPSTVIFVWDGKNESRTKVASGIYICNLNADGMNIRQKIAYISQ